ncbi:hypothetical protein SARC_06748 [Sphaeroforma arctica JP610]|uniref:DUF72 domain-containing protein n=1 Tax=Sphaeroforma arctica JP610 TaxID=667725 RepID=A0A0L0FVP1_9EUKA|nr:hypothetical protein SARC_06748 [Sphaeroforma arctica JP610]KNC80907.1 hypothetical protein SARC_06748 [Sphaeroforma arctica JP610]|eukprot:XP_014154809.1 hypothetical protein SARC_06748 [Sphaeroforma arctica JP610]
MRVKQTLEKEGCKMVVRGSPYGATRKKYGWGTPFAPPKVCSSSKYPNVHIGTSSLSCVSGKDREMQKLMSQYQRKFITLEHCTTYHGVGDAENWQKWKKLARKKKGFTYTIKANNYLTHKRNLKMDLESEAHVQHFFLERCSILGDTFSVGLVQLPSTFVCTEENTSRLRLFATKVPANVKVAVEFRHRTWFNEETYSILREARWALVSGHSPITGNVPVVDTNAGFLYIRLHGALTMYMGDYGQEGLQPWVRPIQEYCDRDATHEAFVFFNNSESEVAGLASSVVDATHFAELLDKSTAPGSETREKVSRTNEPMVQPPLESEPRAGQPLNTTPESGPINGPPSENTEVNLGAGNASSSGRPTGTPHAPTEEAENADANSVGEPNSERISSTKRKQSDDGSKPTKIQKA